MAFLGVNYQVEHMMSISIQSHLFSFFIFDVCLEATPESQQLLLALH